MTEVGSAYVRIRPSLAGFKGEATAGVKAALRGVTADVAAAARANVAAAKEEMAANEALATSYKEIALAAKRGSEEQKIAANLAAESTVRAEHRIKVAGEEAAVSTEKVKHHLLGLGSALGIAFGVEEAVKFTKEITGSAASVQKSIEVIKSSFGKDASEVVVGFGDTVAAQLGISAEAADATSARFGILFHNLNIGPDIASKMTVNLEKLAGSLSAIRGVDPSRALSQITLAMLGNVRSLKQLGVSVDPASEKIAAFKLGLISSTKDALTPAIRAEAIYALATAHLGEYQAQAARHSHDYATVQRRVAAEWSNAKDILGTALLPAFNKLSIGLGDWLERMNKSGRLQKDVNADFRTAGQVIDAFKDIIHEVAPPLETLVGLLGGLKSAIKDVIEIWAAVKIGSFVDGFTRIGTSAKVAKGEVGGFATAWGKLAKLGVIALTVQVLEDFLPKNKNPTRGERIVNKIPLVGPIANATEAGLNAAFGDPNRQPDRPSAARDAALRKKVAADFARQVWGSPAALSGVEPVARGTWGNPAKFVKEIVATTQKAVAEELAKPDPAVAAAAAAAAGRAASAKVLAAARAGINQAKQGIADLKTKLHDLVSQNERDLTDSINSAKANLISIGGTLAQTIGAAIDEPFNVAGRKIQDAQDRLALVFDTKHAKLDAQSRSLHGLAASLQSEQQKIDRLQAQAALKTDLRSLASFRSQVVIPGGLSADPKKALEQLQGLASKHKETRAAVEAFIDKYQAAVLTVRSDRLGLRTGALDARQGVIDRKGQKLDDAQAAATTPLSLRSDRLRVGQDVADARKTRITRQIGDLTAELTSGHIKIGEFNRRIAKLLAADGVTYKKAGSLLGFSFRQGFESQVKGLLDQASALSKGPHRPGTGQEPTVVRPLLVLEKQTREVHTLTRQIGNRQIALQTRIAKATEKAAAAAKKAADAQKSVAAVKLGKTAADVMPGVQTSKTKHLTNTTG